MKWLLYLLAILCLGCSSANRIKRSWNKIQRELEANPGLADSLRIVDHDTIRTERVVDSLVYKPVIDEALVDSLARALCETLKSNDPASIAPQIRRRLATTGCPEVAKDTTYMVKITYMGITSEIPIRLNVRLHNGELKLSILATEIEIPTRHTNLKIDVKNDAIPVWRNPWFWSVVGIILILILLIVWRLTRG